MEKSSQQGHLDTHQEATLAENGSRLARADGGRDAWLFLIGCFVFEALIWGEIFYKKQSPRNQRADMLVGFPFSFGVFQVYYTNNLPFSQHPNEVAAIGTSTSGGMDLIAPLTLYILEAWPSIRQLSSISGLVVVLIALVTSSFSTQVWHLILTQGCLYAIGGSFLYAPAMFYLDEWFILRKGLAFGIMWAGVGTVRLTFPAPEVQV
jgi:hypothetical protein